MPALPSRPRIAALAAVFIAAVVLPYLAGWTPLARIPELAGFVLGAMLMGCLGVGGQTADRAIMPPVFIIIFSSLMLFGPHVATLVAVAATMTPSLVASRALSRQLITDTIIAVAATQAAGAAHRWVGTVPGVFVWPWLAFPITAAVVAYHIVQGAAANVIVPFVMRRPVN